MPEREVILDQPVLIDEQAEAVRQATDRAERAEAELAKMKQAATHTAVSATDATAKQPPSPNTAANASTKSGVSTAAAKQAAASAPVEEVSVSEPWGSSESGEEELRKDSMMAHLLDSLADGKNIGHYGRLVFAMVARHFMKHDDVLAWMTRDQDFSDEQARLMLHQVEGRDYSPPRRDRILEWQSQQEFPILPHPEDPDCGNLYRNLKFPNEIYEHIGHYQEAKAESGA